MAELDDHLRSAAHDVRASVAPIELGDPSMASVRGRHERTRRRRRSWSGVGAAALLLGGVTMAVVRDPAVGTDTGIDVFADGPSASGATAPPPDPTTGTSSPTTTVAPTPSTGFAPPLPGVDVASRDSWERWRSTRPPEYRMRAVWYNASPAPSVVIGPADVTVVVVDGVETVVASVDPETGAPVEWNGYTIDRMYEFMVEGWQTPRMTTATHLDVAGIPAELTFLSASGAKFGFEVQAFTTP